MRRCAIFAFSVTVLMLSGAGSAPAAEAKAEKVGRRPYEMDWAGRAKDDHVPLVDFEDPAGWRVEVEGAVAQFERTREQQLWGTCVGKLTYRGTGHRPVVTIRPPKPITIAAPFDCVNLWAYGNNWAWRPDPTTPRVRISVLLQDGAGKVHEIPMATVRWREWWLMHRKLTEPQRTALRTGGRFVGIRVAGGRNTDDRVLYFDNLSLYTEGLKPLTFPPRRLRGARVFPGQSPGLNTGPGRLPFPTREQTILPDNLTSGFKASLQVDPKSFLFTYAGADGALTYRLIPTTDSFGQVEVQWDKRKPFRVLAGGGVRLVTPKGLAAPTKYRLLASERKGETVVLRWRVAAGKVAAEVEHVYRLWQKSLVVDVRCLGGQVGEFAIGRAVGTENPRLVTVPYLVGDATRPAVLVMGRPEEPLFLTALMDYTRSNASRLTFVNRVSDDGVWCNGGSAYEPKTDGAITCGPRLRRGGMRLGWRACVEERDRAPAGPDIHSPGRSPGTMTLPSPSPVRARQVSRLFRTPGPGSAWARPVPRASPWAGMSGPCRAPAQIRFLMDGWDHAMALPKPSSGTRSERV